MVEVWHEIGGPRLCDYGNRGLHRNRRPREQRIVHYQPAVGMVRWLPTPGVERYARQPWAWPLCHDGSAVHIILFMSMFTPHPSCIPNIPTSKDLFVSQLPNPAHALVLLSTPRTRYPSPFPQNIRVTNVILPNSSAPGITVLLLSDRQSVLQYWLK